VSAEPGGHTSCSYEDKVNAADLRRRQSLVALLAGVNDLVEQAVKQSEHHDDEVIRRRLDQHLAVKSDEVETRLNEPVKQIPQHVSMLLSHCTRQLNHVTVVQ